MLPRFRLSDQTFAASYIIIGITWTRTAIVRLYTDKLVFCDCYVLQVYAMCAYLGLLLLPLVLL